MSIKQLAVKIPLLANELATVQQNLTHEQLGLLFEQGKFTMLARAVEQCQALPSLKAVKKYLKQTGLFNGYMPSNEA